MRLVAVQVRVAYPGTADGAPLWAQLCLDGASSDAAAAAAVICRQQGFAYGATAYEPQ